MVTDVCLLLGIVTSEEDLKGFHSNEGQVTQGQLLWSLHLLAQASMLSTLLRNVPGKISYNSHVFINIKFLLTTCHMWLSRELFERKSWHVSWIRRVLFSIQFYLTIKLLRSVIKGTWTSSASETWYQSKACLETFSIGKSFENQNFPG